MSATTIKGIEQGRAAKAYEFALQGAAMTKKKEYKSYVKKMPMLIKTNGLGAALAFSYAKGSNSGKPDQQKAWGLLYHHLEVWLKEDSKKLIEFSDNHLTQKLMETDSATYRAVTVEVLALLNWLRRFAEALIEGDAENVD